MQDGSRELHLVVFDESLVEELLRELSHDPCCPVLCGPDEMLVALNDLGLDERYRKQFLFSNQLESALTYGTGALRMTAK